MESIAGMDSEQLKLRILINKQIVMFDMINGEINQLYAVNWLIFYKISYLLYENTWQNI